MFYVRVVQFPSYQLVHVREHIVFSGHPENFPEGDDGGPDAVGHGEVISRGSVNDQRGLQHTRIEVGTG